MLKHLKKTFCDCEYTREVLDKQDFSVVCSCQVWCQDNSLQFLYLNKFDSLL